MGRKEGSVGRVEAHVGIREGGLRLCLAKSGRCPKRMQGT